MWADAMRAIQDNLPDVDFVKPIKTQRSSDLTIVPNVIGMTAGDARTTLEGLGFVVNVAGQISSTLPGGLVAQTSPAAGSTMYTGSTVLLYTSTGTAAPSTPSPTGPTGGGNGPPTFGPSPTSGPTCHGHHCH